MRLLIAVNLLGFKFQKIIELILVIHTNEQEIKQKFEHIKDNNILLALDSA